MTRDQREIHRKKRVLEYAKRIGNINKACRYSGVARSSFYEWRDRYRELGDEGEENLWSHRPAVFIFNHQSGLDSLLMAQLTQRDVVGVAKKELETTPIVGTLMKAAGVVFVDRGARSKAIEAMKPAVDAMREGLSVVIAPEGTRSATRKIGKFKKGAFHMEMAAGVPIIPVVIKNALDALPRHGLVIRSTTIDIVVHPPIPTSDWQREDLEARSSEIEALYEATLADYRFSSGLPRRCGRRRT